MRRYEYDASRVARRGLVPVRIFEESRSNVGFAFAAYRDAANDTLQWINGRRGWLRAPDFRAGRSVSAGHSPRKSASALATLHERLRERLFSAMATHDPTAARIERVLDRVSARIRRLLPDDLEPHGLPTLDLYGAQRTPFAVLEYSTGVRLGGQVGGVSCMNPRIHGFAIPLPEEPWTSALGDFYHRHGCCGVGDDGRALQSEIAKAWPRQTSVIRLDNDVARAEEGTEAWFPIRARGPGVEGLRGWILMPDNCD